jgi:hypothetical protein
LARGWKTRHQTHSARITHNELHDTPYTAIACGGAGIYITFCDNVKMRGNVVRDIKKSAGAGTSAYYMDEHTAYSILDGNLCVDVARPMHNHISNNNTICNNVFIMPGAGYYTLERSSDYTFEKNILISDD